MDTETRMALIRQVGEEIVTEEELKLLLEVKQHPVAYDGFEPSGNIHIAQGLMRAINVNRMIAAGVRFTMLVADWHAWANNKLGGDLEKIEVAGKYMIEVWKACGMEVEHVTFLRSRDVIQDTDYWKTVMQVARDSTMNRMIRCCQIMGRNECDNLSAAQILYPCMQCSDIFHLKADITQLGMDQRKVNMLARELGPKLGFWKPVVVSHHMLMGLCMPPAHENSSAERAIELKMSKSKPDSAIFMTDSEAEIKRKIAKAYCPEKTIAENPILDYANHIIFPKLNSFTIERPKKFGGDVTFTSYDELARTFARGELHPADLKAGVAGALNTLIEPVRSHFEKNRAAHELLEKVKGFEVTR